MRSIESLARRSVESLLMVALFASSPAYAQSCATQALGCAPMGTTGELLTPSAVPRVMKVVEVVRGALAFKDLLDEAQVAHVEQVLIQCAREADFQVNQREYPKEGSPSDKECNRVVGSDSRGNPVRRAMELGVMRHEAAFACVERELGQEFSGHLTREPRYARSQSGEGYTLTQDSAGSLVPDIVIHWVDNANMIHRLYDFFFPCTARSKSDPLGAQGKLDKYKPLAADGKRSLVTPQLGISQ